MNSHACFISIISLFVIAHRPTVILRGLRASDVQIVFFHFESNRIVERLFEISNQIE